MVGRIDGLEIYTQKGKLRKGYTIKDDIKKAVRKLVKAKLEGKSLSDIDMVDLTPAQQELVKSFSGAKYVRQIKNAILQYTNVVGTVARNQKFAKLKPIALKEEILKTQRLYQEQVALADEMKELDRTNEEYTAETININGKERPVYNSEGNRIAKSEKVLRAFYEWFGDSKVVDDQGRPLVVYHGTRAEFDTFDTRSENVSNGLAKIFGQQVNMGSHFTTSKEDSRVYRSRIYGVYLKIYNPYFVDDGMKFGQKSKQEGLNVMDDLIRQGYDGVVYYPTHYWTDSTSGKPVEHIEKDALSFVGFSPNQIKSVGNRGTFDPENPNIYLQETITDNEMDVANDMRKRLGVEGAIYELEYTKRLFDRSLNSEHPSVVEMTKKRIASLDRQIEWLKAGNQLTVKQKPIDQSMNTTAKEYFGTTTNINEA